MKQIIVLVLLLYCGKMVGQKMLPMPINAKPTRKYAQCLIPDSAHRKEYSRFIPVFSWDEYLLEITPKSELITLELPVFDTITLKIAVDRATRLANLPDEYILIDELIKVNPSSYKWIVDTENKECLATNPSNCFVLSIVKVRPEYKWIQKLVLKTSAHQQRYEYKDRDTVIFKQIVETKPLKRIACNASPKYEKVFLKQNPYCVYTEWREIICADNDRDDNMDNMDNVTVLKIQKALKKQGYNVGKLDGILGEKTRTALNQFSVDKGLPSSPQETMIALGLLRDWTDDD
jgi:hypothetical protein